MCFNLNCFNLCLSSSSKSKTKPKISKNTENLGLNSNLNLKTEKIKSDLITEQEQINNLDNHHQTLVNFKTTTNSFETLTTSDTLRKYYTNLLDDDNPLLVSPKRKPQSFLFTNQLKFSKLDQIFLNNSINTCIYCNSSLVCNCSSLQIDDIINTKDKTSLLTSSSLSSLSSQSPSCLSSVTTLSANKMQSDAKKSSNIPKNLENVFSASLNIRPVGLSRPGMGLGSKIGQPELEINKLSTKKQAYYFDSKQLIGKPYILETDDDKELSTILDEELNSSDFNGAGSSTSSLKQQAHKRHHNQHRPHHSYKSRGGKITISSDKVYEFIESDIQDLGQIGNGEFGSVLKVMHKPSGTFMALKRIGPTVGNQGERKKVLKELDFVLECHDYEYVVKFYGVKFNNEPADCLILMELMDTSLEKFYKFVYDVKHEEIPESILGKIVVATVNALNYLKEKHKIIHRDVKPSNILINRHGSIKMCDFGISGKLVDSIAASRDAGCQLYMAPERIDPVRACAHGYDVRSDVWSLGITLYELATGKFPYPQWKTIFHQLNLVVDNDAPRLESERLSEDFRNFVNTCLTKDEKQRPKYNVLLQHPLIVTHSNSGVNISAYAEPYINAMLQSNNK